MKKVILFLLSVVLLSITTSNAAIEKRGIVIYFELSPAGSFEAKTSSVRGTIKRKGGKFFAKELSVRIKSLKTGMDLRDKHVHQRLGNKKNKRVQFINAKGANGKGTATLVIKNKEKKVKFTYKVYKKKFIKAVMKFSTRSFGFKDMRHFGVGVEDNIRIEIMLPFEK